MQHRGSSALAGVVGRGWRWAARRCRWCRRGRRWSRNDRHEFRHYRIRNEVEGGARASVDGGTDETSEDDVTGEGGASRSMNLAADLDLDRLEALFFDLHDESAAAIGLERGGRSAGQPG